MKRSRIAWYGLALAGTLAFAGLGCWQLGRAQEKERALAAFAGAMAEAPVELADLVRDGALPSDLPRRVQLRGRYDDAITVLLDNRMLDGRPGIEVLTLFVPNDGAQGLLVNRGWLPLPPDRRPPAIEAAGPLRSQIDGLLRPPPAPGVQLGNAEFSRGAPPPLLAYLDFDALERQSGTRLMRAVLQLSPAATHGFTRSWQALPNTMPPERHRGYAVQWFALALLVPVTTLVLAWRK